MADEPRSSSTVLFWKMAAYAGIAVLAGLTLPDWRFRGAVWVILGALGVKTWVGDQRDRMPN